SLLRKSYLCRARPSCLMTKQFLLAAAPPSPGAAAFCFNFRRNNSQNPRLLAPSRPPRRRQSTITARLPYRRVSPPFAPARRHARPRSRGVEERGSRPAMALPARSARAISVQYQASVFNFARSWDQFILISILTGPPRRVARTVLGGLYDPRAHRRRPRTRQ